jgi:ferrous iron transport protein A
MIPLVFADAQVEQVIKKIGGSDEVKRHLANLGFTVGGTVTVVNSLSGNLIVKVKESRVAVNEEMARRIMV